MFLGKGCGNRLCGDPHSHSQADFRMYREGKGVSRNFNTALWWYEKAYDVEEKENLIYEAANYYEERKDYDEAINWLLKGVHNVSKQNYIGVMYWNSKRYNQAFKWFEKASHWSSKCTARGWAYFNLAKCYLYGQGVEQNKYIAKRHFKNAVEEGIDVDESWFKACW